MADNVQLQGIEFQIVGESEKAVGGIKALSSSLRKLQNLTGKGLGLQKIAQEMKDFNDALGDNHNGGLLNMASAVSDIARASRSIMTVRGHLQGISDLDFSNVENLAQSIGAIAGAMGVRNGGRAGGNGNTIPTDLPTGTPETEHVDGSTQSMKEHAEATDQAAESAKKFMAVMQKVGGILKNGAVSAGKFGFKMAAMPFKHMAAQIKKTIAPMKQFISSLGRIALYRTVRGLISGITTALKEGIKNLYAYSKAVGTTFHQSMNTIATDAQWLKNSFAAAVAPILNALAPALDALAAKIATVLNLLAQLFAMLGGHSTYTKAVKATKEFGEVSGGAAKEMRMLISGFDELNAFQEKSGGGGGVDASSMFEEASVEDGIGDFAKKLKEAFEKGDWDTLGNLLGDKVNEIFDNIKWAKIGTNLGQKIKGVINTAYAFLKRVNFKKIGGNIATLISNIFANVDFDKAGRLFTRKLTAFFDFIIGFIETMDWPTVAKSIGDFLKGIFEEAGEWLRETDWAKVGQSISNAIVPLLDAILEAVRTIPWKEVGTALGTMLANIDWLAVISDVAEIIFEVVKGVVSGLLDTSGGRIFLLILAAVKGLPLIFSLVQPHLVSAVTSFVSSGISALQGMAPQIAAMAPAIGKAALLCADAVLVAYDVKELTNAAQTYQAAFDAHQHETDTALSSYAKLYEEKGKEVADQWAEMVYQVDTTNMNFDEAQRELTRKIETYWDGVPQNMWDGFKQGWNSYFGEGGSGLLGLCSDAFTGLVSGVKGLLGINSPSTVFESIGSNLVEGLKNGISNAWSGLWSKVTSLVNSLTAGVKNLFGVASPSKVFAEIGGYLDAGLASGMEGGVSGLLSTAGKIANSVTTALTPELPSVDSMAMSLTPSGASAVNPVTGYNDDYEEESMSGIASLLEQMFAFMQTSSQGDRDTKIIIDGREVFNVVVSENNRAIQRTGASPIRV